MALLIPSSSSKATTIPEEKYIFEVEMVEVLGAILTSKKAIVLFGFVYTNPQLAPTLFFYFFDQDAFLAPHKFNVKTFSLFFEKGKTKKRPPASSARGARKSFGDHQGTGRIFCPTERCAQKISTLSPLTIPIFSVPEQQPTATLSKDTKFCRCRLNILTEKTTQ